LGIPLQILEVAARDLRSQICSIETATLQNKKLGYSTADLIIFNIRVFKTVVASQSTNKAVIFNP
jgi:hypothetical protein